jgi:hypothetical protein
MSKNGGKLTLSVELEEAIPPTNSRSSFSFCFFEAELGIPAALEISRLQRLSLSSIVRHPPRKSAKAHDNLQAHQPLIHFISAVNSLFQYY